MSFDSRVTLSRVKFLVTDRRRPKAERKEQRRVIGRIGPLLVKCDDPPRPYGLQHERHVDRSALIRALERFTRQTVFTILPVAVPANRRPDWARHDRVSPVLLDLVTGRVPGPVADDMRRFEASFDEALRERVDEAQDRLLTAVRYLAEALARDIGGDFEWMFPGNAWGSGCYAVAEGTLFALMSYVTHAAAAGDIAAAERAIELIEKARFFPPIGAKLIESGRWYALVRKEIGG